MERVRGSFRSAGIRRLDVASLHRLLQRVGCDNTAVGPTMDVEQMLAAYVRDHSLDSSSKIEVEKFLAWLEVAGRSSSAGEEVKAADVVRRLACRGFSLQSLITFLRHLAQVMPHFSHSCTRTVDVVWEVIIPETAVKGCAYADLMEEEGGAGKLPDKMVSHNWGNIFSHLMAAVFADAMEKTTFWEVLGLLQQPYGLDMIEAHLKDSGMLGSTRWLCIFCVNQHISICDRPSGGCDSVTGIPYSPCACGRQKIHTGTGCEMNKFDEMIELFKTEKSNYRHLAAADCKLEVLTRIWVIAELAEVFKQGLSCRVMLHQANIVEVEERTSTLDVRSATASRPEDVHMILEKIPDKDRFNDLTQTAILGMAYLSAVESLIGFRKVMKSIDDDSSGDSSDEDDWTNKLEKMKTGLTEATTLKEVKESWGDMASQVGELNTAYADDMVRATRAVQPWLYIESSKRMRQASAIVNAPAYCLETMWQMRAESYGCSPLRVAGSATAKVMSCCRLPFMVCCVAAGPKKQELGEMLEQVSLQLQSKRADNEYDSLDDSSFGDGAYSAGVMMVWYEDRGLTSPRFSLHKGLLQQEPPLHYSGPWETGGVVEFIEASAFPVLGMLHEVNRAWYRTFAQRGLLALWLGSAELEEAGAARSFIEQLTAAKSSPAMREKLAGCPCCVLHPSAMNSYALKRFIGPSVDDEVVDKAICGRGLTDKWESNAGIVACREWAAMQEKVPPQLFFFLGNLSASNGIKRASMRWRRASHEERDEGGCVGRCHRYSLPLHEGQSLSTQVIEDFCEQAMAGAVAADDFYADQLLLADRFILPIKWASPASSRRTSSSAADSSDESDSSD